MANDVMIKGGADFTQVFQQFKGLSDGLGKLITKGNLIKGVFGTAFAFAAREISKAIDEVMEMNHQLIIQARRSGAGVEPLQAWAKNAARYGNTIEDVTTLLQKLELQREKAMQEGPEGKLVKAFEKLGISRGDLGLKNAGELMKEMNDRLSKAGGTMGNMVALADIFGAKMVKNAKFLQEDREKAERDLRERGGKYWISQNQSIRLEGLRQTSVNMGTYGESFTRTLKSPETVIAIKEAGIALKSLFKLFDDVPRLGLERAWEKYGEVHGQMRAGSGVRMGKGFITPEEYAKIQAANEEKQARHKILEDTAKELDNKLMTPMERVEKLRGEVARREADLAKIRKVGSTDWLQASNDLKDAQLRLREAQGSLKAPNLGTNPFLQIGGLMGVDTNYRIMMLQEQIANNTAIIANNTSPKSQPAPPEPSPIPSFSGGGGRFRGHGAGGSWDTAEKTPMQLHMGGL